MSNIDAPKLFRIDLQFKHQAFTFQVLYFFHVLAGVTHVARQILYGNHFLMSCLYTC